MQYVFLRETEGDPSHSENDPSHPENGPTNADGEPSLATGDPTHTGAEASHSGGHSGPICGNNTSTCRLQGVANCAKDNVCVDKFTFIIFPFLSLFLGVLAMPLSRKIRVPYTLSLLLVGIILGLVGCATDLGLLSLSLQQWVHLSPPTAFFYIFLAPLIFEAAFNTRWHVFKRLLLPILTAAFVIVMIQTGLIAAFQKIVIQTPGWSWWAALMFGSMLSATDPISVTATLKALGASEFLNTLIEGESLVNDGSAFVLWEAFFENTVEDGSLSIGDIILSIFRLSVGGMLMGVAFGIAALLVLGLVYDEFEVETSITVIVAFLGFWTAQSPSRLSGVICNVASGLVLSAYGRHLITPAVRGPLAEFWELLGWIANTIVFVHSGVLLTAFTWSCAGDPNGYQDYLYIFAYYLFLQVIRIGLILIFRPVMAIGNKWFQWKEALVVGFSGLRGAVSLVLALEVAGANINDNVQSRVVLWTTGIVGLSLFVNGFLVKPLIKYLKLDRAKKSREDFLHRARAIMVQRSLTILDTLCIETGFKAARWSYVVKHSLPPAWLEEQNSEEGYYQAAVDQLMDNAAIFSRASLENVRRERQDRINHAHLHERASKDAHIPPRTSGFAQGPPQFNSRTSVDVMHAGAHMSPRTSGFGAGARNHEATPWMPQGRPSGLREGPPVAQALAETQGAGNFSMDVTNRRSIEADVARYGRRPLRGNFTHANVHQDVANLHENMRSGQIYDFTEQDREIQRRLLTSILSHVRALSNASLVEFNVLYSLEQDVQLALDANDEGHDYDLFSFLDNHGRQRSTRVYKSYLRVVEGKNLQGQTAITTAVVIFGIMTEILKEEILYSSPIVQLQAEHLYEAAAALLNRLEAINPVALEWVESQFAIYVSARKQDEVLEEMLQSGIVDKQEFKVIRHELIDVRRKHVDSRHSIMNWGRARFPERPKPRAMIRDHPLFSKLPSTMMSSIVDRFGQIVHLNPGQTLKAGKGSLIIVLKGAIRPVEDKALPPTIATQMQTNVAAGDPMSAPGQQMAQKRSPNSTPDPQASDSQSYSNSRGFGAVVDTPDAEGIPGLTLLASGATMHWCFPAYNDFCGSIVTLHSHHGGDGNICPIAMDRTIDNEFCACEIAGTATVFTLPVAQVSMLANGSPEFKMEITRSLAREIVLESVADQRPYSLSHFMDSMPGETDVTTVIGRAFRVLERLPYMSVTVLESGELAQQLVHGPGVLLNGTVRVSIVDTSGLVGAVNLLHEELTGPALLPAGGLIIEEVHKRADSDELPEVDESGEPPEVPADAVARTGSRETEVLEICDMQGSGSTTLQSGEPRVLAHILTEEVREEDRTALLRLERWTRPDIQVDMNGRFGMYRHVELAHFTEAKVV